MGESWVSLILAQRRSTLRQSERLVAVATLALLIPQALFQSQSDQGVYLAISCHPDTVRQLSHGRNRRVAFAALIEIMPLNWPRRIVACTSVIPGIWKFSVETNVSLPPTLLINKPDATGDAVVITLKAGGK